MSLREGMLLCKGPPLPYKSLKFKAILLTMSGLQPPIIPGSTFELYLHGEVVQCCITKLYSIQLTANEDGGSANRNLFKEKKLNNLKSSSSSKVINQKINNTKNNENTYENGNKNTNESRNNIDKNRQENPKCIPGGRCAKVKIEVTHSICIEPFKICDALGRFALRTKGKTCAVGIIEKVKKID